MNSSKRGAAYGFRLQSLDLVSKTSLKPNNQSLFPLQNHNKNTKTKVTIDFLQIIQEAFVQPTIISLIFFLPFFYFVLQAFRH